jgi:hypothetical protein
MSKKDILGPWITQAMHEKLRRRPYVLSVVTEKGGGYTVVAEVRPDTDITSEDIWRAALPGDFAERLRENGSGIYIMAGTRDTPGHPDFYKAAGARNRMMSDVSGKLQSPERRRE